MGISPVLGGARRSPKDKLSRVVANYPVLEVLGKAGQAPGCFLPDMLVVAVEGLVDVEQENKVFLQMGLLANMLEQLRGQQLNWL